MKTNNSKVNLVVVLAMAVLALAAQSVWAAELATVKAATAATTITDAAMAKAGQISVEVMPQNPTVLAGITNLSLAQIKLTNSTRAARQLVELPIWLEANRLLVNMVGNLKLADQDSGQILATAEIVGNKRQAWVVFQPANCQINPGQNRVFIVKADILSCAGKEATLKSSLRTPMIRFDRPVKIEPRGKLTLGQINIRQKGELSIESFPLANFDGDQVLAANLEMSAISINLGALYEDITIESLPIYVGKINSGGPDQITKISAYSGSRLMGEVVPTGGDGCQEDPVPMPLMQFNPPLVVPGNNQLALLIKVTTAGCGDNEGGESGEGFDLCIPGEEIHGIGRQSCQTISGTGEALSNEFYLFKNTPVMIPNEKLWFGSFPYAGGRLELGDQGLYGLGLAPNNIPAPTSEDGYIAVKRLSFKVECSQNVTFLDNIARLCYMRPGDSCVSELCQSEIGEDGIVIFDLPTRFAFGDITWFQIRAHVTYTNGGIAEDRWVSTILLGDENFVNPLPATCDEAASQSYFIWTDFGKDSLLIGDENLAQWVNARGVWTANNSLWPAMSQPVVIRY